LIGGAKAIVTFDTHLPLNERLLRIDHIQARRYSKLNGISLEIATEGIVRHLRACDRMDVNPETSAVREIIDDALNGRRVFAETAEHPAQLRFRLTIHLRGRPRQGDLFSFSNFRPLREKDPAQVDQNTDRHANIPRQ